MGKPLLHISVRTAFEGLKAEIVASPEVWEAIAENGGDWSLLSDDTSIQLDLPLLSWPPDDGAIEIVKLETRAGADEWNDDAAQFPVYEWDDAVHGFVLREDHP